MKKYLIMSLMFTLMTLIFCLGAFALDTIPAHAAVTQPNVVTDFLQQSVFPIVTALFMGVVSIFLNRLGQKYKVDALTQQNNIVEQLAFQGITKAEEVAAKYTDTKLALSGSDKLSIAVSHILSYMPKVSDDQAKSMVHSVLAQIPGLGASGDTVVSKGPSFTLGALADASPAALLPETTAAAAS